MMMRKKFSQLFTWLCVSVGVSVGACQEHCEVKILWPGSKEYERKVLHFKFSPNDALAAIIANTKNHKYKYFHTKPLLLADDFYMFSLPHKTAEIEIKGFYVNANSLRIEYRESSQVKYGKRFCIEMSDYEYIEVIKD